jgi:hypothetical protein
MNYLTKVWNSASHSAACHPTQRFDLISLCPIFLKVDPDQPPSTPNQPTNHSQLAVATLPISRYAMHQAKQSKAK